MKSIIKFLWRWSWVVTLPVVSLSIFISVSTLDCYLAMAVRYRPGLPFPPDGYYLRFIGSIEFSRLIRRLQLLAPDLESRKEECQKQLKTINLFVPESGVEQLNAHLPHSGFRYIQAGIWNKDTVQPIKLRYRGDYLYHWASPKKSLRVKTRKRALFDDMRTFNLINPKGNSNLLNYFGYRLASTMGLISPRTEMVNVAINGKQMGVYAMVEQLGESTLRKHRLMPGDLYVGELVAKDRWWGTLLLVFDHPGLWEKAAFNNHYPEESHNPLVFLIETLFHASPEKMHEELGTLLDMEAWGRFSAFESLAATFHYLPTHNWRIYFDPARSRFFPVVWDPAAWAWAPKNGDPNYLDVVSSRFHSRLFQNGDFLRFRQKAIEGFFESGKDKLFLAEMDRIIPVMEAAVKQDPNNPAPKKSIAAMRELRETVERVFDDIRQSYLGQTGAVLVARGKVPGEMSLLLSGRRPINRLVLSYSNPIEAPVSATIQYYQGRSKVAVDVSGAVSTNGTEIEISTVLIPNIILKKPMKPEFRPEIDPGYYELVIDGVALDNSLQEVLVDRGGDTMQPAQSVENIEKRSFQEMYAIVRPLPRKDPIIWEGEIVIDGVREIGDEVIIRPGTTVRLHPGAAIIFYSRLIAGGTSQNPIRFLPVKSTDDPWGTVVLKGRSADGSKLSNCEFKGGSGLKGDLFEYSAMLSVHDVSSVSVENCYFHDNKIVDDMVHTVYSDIAFSDCVFERAHADALDLDISNATIENCRIINSGNDAIDLMTTRTELGDTVLKGSGDKGISVGEDSRLFMVNSQVLANNIGVQVKDSSVAALFNIDLAKNGVAVDAYKKNWQYNGGGKCFIYKSRLLDNGRQHTADKHSMIQVYDSFVEMGGKEVKNIRYHPTVDEKNRGVAKSSELLRFNEERLLMKGTESLLPKVRPEKRGCSSL